MELSLRRWSAAVIDAETAALQPVAVKFYRRAAAQRWVDARNKGEGLAVGRFIVVPARFESIHD